ncbi:lysozyme [Pseudooceanicola sp. MF1-13]|uniref:lysozyme n=1 Tax=Pseudooceanicola sp. MF1-13 TaxID=3379095 RepID=UPI0038923B34
MKLIENWRDIALKAWSMWGVYALMLVNIVAYVLPQFETEMSAGWYQVLTALCALLIGVGRLLDQADLSDFLRDTSGAIRKRAAAGVGAAAIVAAAVGFIEPWEGTRLNAYQDVVGVWTVCAGETQNVRAGDRYTQAECDAMLADRVAEFRDRLQTCLPSLPKLPTGVQVAFISWSYNVGTGAACRSTLVRKANAGDVVGACNELPRWNRAGGRVIRGLTNRRLSERQLCLTALDQAT